MSIYSYIISVCYQGPGPVVLPHTHADGTLFTIHYLNEKEVREHLLAGPALAKQCWMGTQDVTVGCEHSVQSTLN